MPVQKIERGGERFAADKAAIELLEFFGSLNTPPESAVDAMVLALVFVQTQGGKVYDAKEEVEEFAIEIGQMIVVNAKAVGEASKKLRKKGTN